MRRYIDYTDVDRIEYTFSNKFKIKNRCLEMPHFKQSTKKLRTKTYIDYECPNRRCLKDSGLCFILNLGKSICCPTSNIEMYGRPKKFVKRRTSKISKLNFVKSVGTLYIILSSQGIGCMGRSTLLV